MLGWHISVYRQTDGAHRLRRQSLLTVHVWPSGKQGLGG